MFWNRIANQNHFLDCICCAIVAIAARQGVALNKAGSKTNFYGNTNGIVHVLLKVTFDWTLAKHTMPIHACMVWNPQADRAFFQLGIQLFNL